MTTAIDTATATPTHIKVTWNTTVTEEWIHNIPIADVAEALEISEEEVLDLLKNDRLGEVWQDDEGSLLPGLEGSTDGGGYESTERWIDSFEAKTRTKNQ